MDTKVGRVAGGEQALVSDQARAGLDPTGFDPSRFREAYLVWLCDETGENAVCQDTGIVDSVEAFAAFVAHEYADARPYGNDGMAYTLHAKDTGDDLGFNLVLVPYPFWERSAIAMETQSATTAGRGPKDGSAAIAQKVFQ